MRRTGTTITVAALAALAVAGGGAAIAATKLSPQEESRAVVSDAAKQLGIAPERLSAALEQALENRVDAAVEAGELTQAQGDALKERIQAGEVPLLAPARGFGHGPRGHHGPRGRGLDAAAAYLGVTEDALRDELRSGKSLADVAEEQGKSVEGLVAALLDAAEERLDAAVEAGRITEAQKTERLAALRSRVEAMVDGTFGPRGFRGGPPADDERGGSDGNASFFA